MTYKSDVLVELEKIAIKKGYYDRKPEEMVKTAAKRSGPTLTPGNALLVDLCRLADGLKHRGFDKQAKELESKIVAFKTAQSLYNIKTDSPEELSEFAHRDGDVSIVDAQDELGVIETVQSAAKKVREVARKNPKGKAASVAESIVKKAQLEETAEKQIGNAIGAFQQAKNAVPFKPQEVSFNNVNWQDPKVQALYEKYANLPQGSVAKYNQVWAQLNSAGVMNGVAIWPGKIQALAANAPETARGIAAVLDGKLVPKYFDGVSARDPLAGQKQPPNASSIYYEDQRGQKATKGALPWGAVKANRAALESEITDAWNKYYTSVWGRLDAANMALQSDVVKVFQQVKGIPQSLKGNIKADLLANGEVVKAGNASKILAEMKANLAKISGYENLFNLLSVLDSGKADALVKWIENINGAAEGIESVVGMMAGGQEIPGMDAMVGAATAAAVKYQQLARSLTGRDQENAAENANNLGKMLRVLKSSGNSWRLLQSTIEREFGSKFETPDALRAAIDSFVASANAVEEKLQGGK